MTQLRKKRTTCFCHTQEDGQFASVENASALGDDFKKNTNNYRCTRCCKKMYREIPYTLYPDSPNGNILYNQSMISKSENWCSYNPPTLFNFYQCYMLSFVCVRVCVCVVLCNFITRVDIKQFHYHRDSSSCRFITILPPPLHLSPPPLPQVSNFQQPQIMSSSL